MHQTVSSLEVLLRRYRRTSFIESLSTDLIAVTSFATSKEDACVGVMISYHCALIFFVNITVQAKGLRFQKVCLCFDGYQIFDIYCKNIDNKPDLWDRSTYENTTPKMAFFLSNDLLYEVCFGNLGQPIDPK